MKVWILTITSTNYGNRLQNYAVNYLMKCINIQPENIVLYDFLSYQKNGIQKSLKKLVPIFLLKVLSRIKHSLRKSLEDKKEAEFFKFTQKYMENRIFYIHTPKDLRKKIKDEAYVIVGSDQIWNPDFAGFDYFFADFTVPEKRIALSASIGYVDLEETCLNQYTNLWKEMKYISVREESAADLIENATGKRPDVILDPTLLLQREEWENIAQKPQCRLPEKYILCLFLGNFPVAVKSQYEEAYGMEMVILNDKTFPDYFVLGPSEFVWLVKNAELILTDSFHCTVFSIIFHKQFWVFEREDNRVKNMFTRLENLLSRFELTDRVQKIGNPLCMGKIEEIQFVKSDEIRFAERKRVMKIMKELL